MTDLARSDAAADTGADRARPPRTIRRWVLLLVFAMGFGHAALYAVTFPPWAIEDEQQHVDYVWKIAHEGQLPTITDEIDYGIVEGIFGTDRFEAYGMARPQPTAESMGLQARSYAAYHPPAVYIALAPVAVVGGERALLTLYLLRFTSALAAGLVAVTTALLAVDLIQLLRRNRSSRSALAAPGSDVPDGSEAIDARWPAAVALAAGVAIAALPALADSGGRVDTDIYATLIKKGKADSAAELKVSRITTLALGVLAVTLGIVFEKQNIAFMVSLAFAIAASANFPVLFMSVLWKDCTTKGAVIGGFLGLVSSVALTVVSPSVWEATLGNPKGSALFPYTSPALFSMAIGFAGIWLFSVLDRSQRARVDRAGFLAQQVRSETGIGAAAASAH